MSCDRFERQGLERWEEGEGPDEHERGCADCQRAREAYARLAEGLRELPPIAPPAGWEERVLAKIGATPASPARAPSTPRWAWLMAAAIVAALFIVLARSSREAPLTASLQVEVIRAAVARRADVAVIGDRLSVRASSRAPHTELRVYRDERELWLRCPGDTRCRVAGGVLEADAVLALRGSYRAVVLTASAPLPAPRGALDDDARAVQAIAGRVEMRPAIEVE